MGNWHAEVLVYSTDKDSLATLRGMVGIIAATQLTPEGLAVTFTGPDTWERAYDKILANVRAAYGSLTEVSDVQEAG